MEVAVSYFVRPTIVLLLLKGSYVRWFSDGQNACKIIQVGSTRSDLHFIAMDIFQLCVDYIALEVQWITRSEIDRADYISRIIDVDDWQMSAAGFASLDTS